VARSADDIGEVMHDSLRILYLHDACGMSHLQVWAIAETAMCAECARRFSQRSSDPRHNTLENGHTVTAISSLQAIPEGAFDKKLA